eukprot:6491870-Amphidinium_carterae.3
MLSGEEENSPEAEGKHWDRPVQISRAHRQMTKELDALEESLQKTLAAVATCRTEVKSLPLAQQQTLQAELSILESRAEVIEKLQAMEKDEFKENLQHEYLTGFDSHMGEEGSGKAPCKNYLELVSMAEIRTVLQDLEGVKTKRGLEELKQRYRDQKKHTNTLSATIMALQRELLKAAEQLVKEQKAKSTEKPKATATSGSIFDVVAEVAGQKGEVTVLQPGASFRQLQHPAELRVPSVFAKASFEKEFNEIWTQEWDTSLQKAVHAAEKEMRKGSAVRTAEAMPEGMATSWKVLRNRLAPVVRAMDQLEIPPHVGAALSPQFFCTSASHVFAQAWQRWHLH